MDEATIHRLMEEDRRDLVRRWNEWANQPITPHLIVCLVPGFFLGQHIPEGVATPQEMEKYASRLAESTGNTVWLILSRRLSIRFDEDGSRRAVSEAARPSPVNHFLRYGVFNGDLFQRAMAARLSCRLWTRQDGTGQRNRRR